MVARTITGAAIVIINLGLIPLAIAHGGSDSGGSADGSLNLRAKGLILVKIWCLLIVFVGTFAGGISPYFYRWNESFLLLGTQFAAGVFLGTAWMHFLSDSAETFGDLTDKTYPFAFMLCTAGYLVTMLGDLIVAWMYQKQDGSNVNAIPLQRIADIRATESGVPTQTCEAALNFQVQTEWITIDGAAIDGFTGCGAWIKITDRERILIHWNGGPGTNNKAEIVALWGGLFIAIDFQIQLRNIFGDSQLIIGWIENCCQMYDQLLSGWKERIISFWNRLHRPSIKHIYRENNTRADRLSKMGLADEFGLMYLSHYADGTMIAEQSIPFP